MQEARTGTATRISACQAQIKASKYCLVKQVVVLLPHSLIAQVVQQGHAVGGRRHAVLPRLPRGRNIGRALCSEPHAPVAARAAALAVALDLCAP